MIIQSLPDDSPLSQEVLPSVWAGYKERPCRPITEAIEQTTQLLQQGYNLSKEKADEISHSFWTGSVHDFCVHYLKGKLTNEDHAKILKTADECIKNSTAIRIDKEEKDLNKLLVAKVVLNAHQRANHAMSYACFLNEIGMLPKENIFMLQKGTSPVFYDKDEFKRSEMLKNNVFDVPEDRLLAAFTKWVHYAGIRYIPALNQMGGLLNDMRYVNALILKKSMEFYTRRNGATRLRRPRPRRYNRRGYGE